MSKILFIGDRIPPEHSASGRLLFALAKQLSNNEDIYFSCLESIQSTPTMHESVYVIKSLSRYGIYQKIIKNNESKRGISKYIGKIIYRIYYLFACKKGLHDVRGHRRIIQKKCQKVIRKNNVDTIISVSNPFENHEIAYKLVKKNPKIKWFPYLMDSNRNNAVYVGSRKLELTYFAFAEKILIVPALLHDQDFLEDFVDKIEVLDLPIIPVEMQPLGKSDDGNITFVYAGKFYEEIRNPRHLFEIFEILPSNYILKIFYGGCSDIVHEYKEKLGDRLQVSGYIAPEELDKVIAKANVVISLGNTVVNQVASKIYDLIAYGKPILNFYQREDDISIGHLAKYPLCKNISYLNADVEEIKMWCEENRFTCLTYEEATRNMREKRLVHCVERLHDIILGQ